MRRGINDVGQVKLGCVLFPKVKDILAWVDRVEGTHNPKAGYRVLRSETKWHCLHLLFSILLRGRCSLSRMNESCKEMQRKGKWRTKVFHARRPERHQKEADTTRSKEAETTRKEAKTTKKEAETTTKRPTPTKEAETTKKEAETTKGSW